MGLSEAKSNIKRYFWLGIATGFGIGFLPGAPGTYGSLLAIILYFFFPKSPIFYALFIILLLPIACISASKAEIYIQRHDPSQVVIDEILGMLVALWTIVPTIFSLFLTFLLFRFFDITKPFPIRQLESLPKGTGIIADDLMAGIYALACIHLLQFVWTSLH